MPGVPSRDDGVQLVEGRRVGEGSGFYRRNRVRPAFMEPDPLVGGRTVEGGGGGGALRMMRNRSSSSFPLKEDAGYIGYLTDDDDSESGGDASDVMMKVLSRRRHELLGYDMSFSGCMLMMIAACGLLMLFLWGVRRGFRPPTAGTSFDRP